MKLLHLLTFLLVLISLGGCSSSDLAPLQGRVILSEDSNFAFQGDVIELKLQSDPAQLAYGEIQPDGSFTVESLWKGKLVSGVQPGVYQARVVIADDEIDHKKRASKVLPKRYLNFDQSGWTIQVPSNDVRLELQTR